jgi:hypothetical protein
MMVTLSRKKKKSLKKFQRSLTLPLKKRNR